MRSGSQTGMSPSTDQAKGTTPFPQLAETTAPPTYPLFLAIFSLSPHSMTLIHSCNTPYTIGNEIQGESDNK